MADLNQCIQCKSPAVEQARGKMGPGDYKEMFKTNHKGHPVPHLDYHLEVEMHDGIRDDVRVSCSKCDNATGWMHVPTKEEQPGVSPDMLAKFGAAVRDSAREAWNHKNAVK